MRKLVVLMVTLLMATNVFAVVKRPTHSSPVWKQHETEESKPRIGFYLAPVLKVGEIRSDLKAMVGVRGGLEINRSFYIGVAGYGLPENNYRHDISYNYGYYDWHDHNNDWALGYGGLELGVITGRPSSGQLSFGVLIGGGAVDDHPYYDGYDHHDEGFFVMEPQFDLSAAISRNVRFSIGAGYRFVDHVHSANYTEDDLRGATINFAIAFGVF